MLATGESHADCSRPHDERNLSESRISEITRPKPTPVMRINAGEFGGSGDHEDYLERLRARAQLLNDAATPESTRVLVRQGSGLTMAELRAIARGLADSTR